MKRIAIHSVPRSGSTWLGQIFNSCPFVSYRYQPLFSYAFKGRLNPRCSLDEIVNFFDELNLSSDPFINQTEAVENGICPKFTKKPVSEFCVYKEVRYHNILENLLNTDPEILVIGLVRNPLSVLSSWLLAPREFNPNWDVQREWRWAPSKNANRPEEFFGFEKWKEVTQLFIRLQKEFPTRFYLVKYLDLLTKTQATIEQLFDFCQIPFCQQTERFLAFSKSREHENEYSVFKKKEDDDGWKQNLPSEISDEIATELSETFYAEFF